MGETANVAASVAYQTPPPHAALAADPPGETEGRSADSDEAGEIVSMERTKEELQKK